WAAGILTPTPAGLTLAATLNTDPPPTPPDPPKAAPAEPTKEKAPLTGPNRILFLRDGQLVMVDPDGKNEKKVSKERGLHQPVEAKLSPDGKRVAVRIKVELPDDPNPLEQPRFWLYVRELDEKEPGTFLGVHAESFAWSPDGTEIAYTDIGKAKEGEQPPMVHGIVNVKTAVRIKLKLPADQMILDWSRDGDHFLTMHADDRDFPTLHLVSRDGK